MFRGSRRNKNHQKSNQFPGSAPALRPQPRQSNGMARRRTLPGGTGHLSQDFMADLSIILSQGFLNMGLSINGGTPKWMVYKGKTEKPIKIDDLGGYPHFRKPPLVIISSHLPMVMRMMKSQVSHTMIPICSHASQPASKASAGHGRPGSADPYGISGIMSLEKMASSCGVWVKPCHVYYPPTITTNRCI